MFYIKLLPPVNTCSTYRELYIDFDHYTGGDQECKLELANLIIKDIDELQQSLKAALEQSRYPFFAKVCHKVFTSLTVLNDTALNRVLDDLKERITQPDDVRFKANVEIMNTYCEGIKNSLRQIASGGETRGSGQM